MVAHDASTGPCVSVDKRWEFKALRSATCKGNWTRAHATGRASGSEPRGSRRLGLAGQLEGSNQIVNVCPGQIEAPRGLSHVPVDRLERSKQQGRLKAARLFLKRQMRASRLIRSPGLAENVLHLDDVGPLATRVDRGAFNHARELPSIAGPLRGLDGAKCTWRENDVRQTVRFRRALAEVDGQRNHVLRPFAQARNANLQDL